ncbi:MAG: hypothetical protein LIO75_07650 [Lachnospiraceae bacterium]|nr:hypothetical protein [Lachnospiraceae bacterium]
MPRTKRPYQLPEPLTCSEDRVRDGVPMSAGMADIRYGNLSEQGKLLADSFFIGILMIADEFPDYIRIR